MSSSGPVGFWKRLRTPKPLTFPLHAYGKLPIYKDFITSGLTEDGARQLREWLDRSFSHRWSNDEECRETEIPPHLFLFRMPGGKRYVAGSLWGSCDQGGLRRFPFMVFVSIPAGAAPADPLAAVGYLRALDARAAELRGGVGAGASLSAFYDAFRGASLELPQKPRAELESEVLGSLADLPIEDFAESLFADDAQARWPLLVAGLEGAAARGADLRLPLGSSLSRKTQLQFWLMWLEGRVPGARRVEGLLYESEDGPGRATFLFRELAPDDIFLLHPKRSLEPRVAELSDIAPPRPSMEGTQPIPRVEVRRQPETPPPAPAPEPAAEVMAPVAAEAAAEVVSVVEEAAPTLTATVTADAPDQVAATAVQEPTVQEPTVQEPAVQEPAVQEPAVQEPAVQEPAGAQGSEIEAAPETAPVAVESEAPPAVEAVKEAVTVDVDAPSAESPAAQPLPAPETTPLEADTTVATIPGPPLEPEPVTPPEDAVVDADAAKKVES